jgi:tetratricopeptide (TPR) repeat protein
VEPIDDFEVLDLLTSLVDKSLVMREEREDDSRYRMLETIRDYAREKLDQDADDAPASAVRHNEFFFLMAKEARNGLEGPEQATWLTRVEAELDNLRAAIALALAGGVDPLRAVKFAVALQGFWIMRGYSTEGRRLVKAALALPAIESSDLAQAHALYVGASLAETQSDYAEALQLLEKCLALRRALGSPVDVAATLSTLSLVRLKAGDAHGAAVDEMEALETFRRMGDRVGEAIGLLHLGQIAYYSGEDAQAAQRLAEALAIAREVDYREVEGECELALGELAFRAGDLATAGQRLDRSLSVSREAADKRGEANALWWLGKVALQAGRLEPARAQLGEALKAFREFEMWGELLGCLEDLAVLARCVGAGDVAVRLAATATTSRKRLGLGRPPRAEALWAAQLEQLRGDVANAGFVDAWNEAWDGWEVDDAIRAAAALPDKAPAELAH